MDCLRSFNILVSANSTVSAGNIATWGVAPQNYWQARETGTSIFNINGFKNVNIYSIEAVGKVQSTLGGTDNVIVQDWGWSIQIIGQAPITNGNITAAPNTFVMQEQGNNPNIQLSKFTPKMEFTTPIQSASQIIISNLSANGIGARNLLAINLSWGFNFVIKYKFEGE